jgi:hypothetical protein
MNILDNAFIGKHFAATLDDPHGLLTAYEEGVAAQVFTKLWELYPLYDWAVKVDARPKMGMVTVKIPGLMGPTFGFNFRLDQLAGDPSMSIVKRAGGEILEHWRLRRGQANRSAFREAKDAWRIMARKFAAMNNVASLGDARSARSVSYAPQALAA